MAFNRRIPNMNDRSVKATLMLSMGDYLASYDAAKLKAEFSPDTQVRIDQERVMGKCVQRIAFIKKALDTFQKDHVRDALTQCLEDCNAAYENARQQAEEAPLIADRIQYEKVKKHCIDRRRMLNASLAELT